MTRCCRMTREKNGCSAPFASCDRRNACSSALSLEEFLLKREGIRCAAFHEGLSIIQRDRAAAWFADPEGAEILLCSEIGSEGRNFQFAHHLLLFDLPLNPDLLEQRIGRLDRIGQRAQVNIHLPYIGGSAQHHLFSWYQQVSCIFKTPDPVIGTLFEQVKEELLGTLNASQKQEVSALIRNHQEIARGLLAEMQHGRERLLSLSSFHHSEAEQIVEMIHKLDREQNLQPFMEQVFDLYGVESEHHSRQREIIRPGDHMMGGHFPHLPDDGAVITFDRDTALVHEDTQYLTWDHPMVTSAIDIEFNRVFIPILMNLVTAPLASSAIDNCLPVPPYWNYSTGWTVRLHQTCQ